MIRHLVGPTDRIWSMLAWAFSAAVLLFLALFAWRFADERLYSDSGYYLARVINEGNFRIEHGRWVLAFSQVLPLICVKAGLPLTAIIKLHSLNNVVWLAGCMLFAGGVLRDRNAVLALAAVHLIGLTHGLFCPIFELYYGVDLLILFHAVLLTDRLNGKVRWALLLTFFLVVISSHLFGALLMVATLLLSRIRHEQRLMIALIALFVLHSVVHIVTLSGYEKDSLSFLQQLATPMDAASVLAPKTLWALLLYILHHYPDIFALAFATTIALLVSHKRMQALFFVALLAAMYVVIALKLPGSMHDRYREQVNFAVVAWVLIVFVQQLIANARWRNGATVLLLMAGMYRVVCAEWIAPHYAARTALIETEIRIARDHGMQKAIVPAPVYFGPKDHAIGLSWSTSVESLLLSAKHGPEGTVSLITTQDLEIKGVRDGLDGFIFRQWDILDPSWLDPRYFRSPSGRYAMLPAPTTP